MKVDKTLDIKGLSRGRPCEVTTNILATLRPGQILRVIVDDAAARKDSPRLCEQLGLKVLATDENGKTVSFTIQK